MDRTRDATLYQIDFSAVASGKHIASTKRRVRWRFGFANMEALANGEVGTACRGEEHDVTFVWSVTSGKRTVLFDGHEVHYSQSRSGIFDHSWNMKAGHILKIVAHSSPPLSPTPGFRQYDFFVDGLSFFSFPKVYRLGMAAGAPAAMVDPAKQAYSSPRRALPPADGIASLEAPSNPDEEEAYLQEAIRQSLQDSKRPPAAAGSASIATGTGDLLDFGAPAPSYATSYSTPSSADPFSAPAAPLALPPSTTTTTNSFAFAGSTPPLHSAASFSYSAAPVPSHNPFAVVDNYPSGGTTPGPAADPWAAGPGGGTAVVTAPASNGHAYYPTSHPMSASLPALPASSTTMENGYGQPFGPPPPTDPYMKAPWNAPPAINTQFYGDNPSVPPSVTPVAQPTPSSIGFQSPAPDFSGFSPLGPSNPPPSETHTYSDPALKTMNALSMDGRNDAGLLDGTNTQTQGSLVDQAYSKLVNMDDFNLSSTKESKSNYDNMFVSNSSIGGNLSLADMQKSKPAPKKEVMKSVQPSVMSAMVPSTQSSSYASQYGVTTPLANSGPTAFGGQSSMSQPMMSSSLSYGQPPAYGGQPPLAQSPAYGLPTQSPYGQAVIQGSSMNQPLGQSLPYGQSFAGAQQPPSHPYGQQPMYARPTQQQNGFPY